VSKASIAKADYGSIYGDYSRFSECDLNNRQLRETGALPAAGMKHQAISLKIAAALLEYVEDGKHGCVLQAPCGVVLSRKVIQSDVLFIAKERRGIIGKAGLYAAPDLIVDLLSPRMQERELRVKKRLYAFYEVKEYWIADPEDSTIEVLLWSELGYLSIGKYDKKDRLSSPLLPDLNLPLLRVFGNEE